MTANFCTTESTHIPASPVSRAPHAGDHTDKYHRRPVTSEGCFSYIDIDSFNANSERRYHVLGGTLRRLMENFFGEHPSMSDVKNFRPLKI